MIDDFPALGYPTSDTHPVTGGVQNEFQHGSLIVLADGASRVVINGADAGVDAGPGLEEPDASVGVIVDAGSPQAEAGTLDVEVDVDAGNAAAPEGVIGGCSTTGGNAAWLLALLCALGRKRSPRLARG